MKRTRGLVLFTFLFVILFGAAHTAFAAEEGGQAANGPAIELFKWINFAIVAGVILWLCFKKAPKFFRGRADEITSAITKATAAKSEAERQLREAETRLANLQQEIAELRVAGEKEAAAEGQRIRALAVTDAQKIEAAAAAEIEAAERAARLELKQIAAKLAVDGAESLLAKQLTPQVQETLINDFVKSLAGSPN